MCIGAFSWFLIGNHCEEKSHAAFAATHVVDHLAIGCDVLLLRGLEMRLNGLSRPFRTRLNQAGHIVTGDSRLTFLIENHVDVAHQAFVHSLVM